MFSYYFSNPATHLANSMGDLTSFSTGETHFHPDFRIWTHLEA